MRGISSLLLQQSAAAAPYLGGGVSPHGCPPDLERGVAPLGPPALAQLRLLACGVAPPDRRPDLGVGSLLSAAHAPVAAWRARPPPLTLGEG